MNLITDRTVADVLQGTAKGQYRTEDLNRVEQAVQELCQLAKALDIPYISAAKTDWRVPGLFSAGQWPTVSQMQRYLGNVKALCEAVAVEAKLPASMEKLNWEGANRIEQALEAVDVRIRNVLQVFQFSGEIFAGEENEL